MTENEVRSLFGFDDDMICFLDIMSSIKDGDLERIVKLMGGDLTQAVGHYPNLIFATIATEFPPNFIARLVEAGVDLFEKNEAYGSAYNALHTAILMSNPNALRELIALGMDVNEPTALGAPPLCCGTSDSFGHIECVKVLLEAGADPNRRNAKGCTPIFRLCCGHWNNEEVQVQTLKELIAAGADPNIPSYSGCTPVMKALESNPPLNHMVAALKEIGCAVPDRELILSFHATQRPDDLSLDEEDLWQ